jgi:hypothetical protein
VLWLPIGLALALYADTSPAQPSDIIDRPVPVSRFVAVWTLWGALSGAGFALLLMLAERRRTIEELSAVRTALWGATGAVTLPLVLVAVDVMSTPVGARGYTWRFPMVVLLVSATLGTLCAAATLFLARRRVTARPSS